MSHRVREKSFEMDLPIFANVGIAVLAGAAAYLGITYLTGPSSAAKPTTTPTTTTPTTPSKSSTPTYTPPKAATPDKSTANVAWAAGCRDGAVAGYAAGYNGSGRNTTAPASAAASSGNAAAYKAGYAQSYDSSFFSGNAAAGIFGLDPDSSSAATTKSKAQSSCAGNFDSWFSSWVAAGAPAG